MNAQGWPSIEKKYHGKGVFHFWDINPPKSHRTFVKRQWNQLDGSSVFYLYELTDIKKTHKTNNSSLTAYRRQKMLLKHKFSVIISIWFSICLWSMAKHSKRKESCLNANAARWSKKKVNSNVKKNQMVAKKKIDNVKSKKQIKRPDQSLVAFFYGNRFFLRKVGNLDVSWWDDIRKFLVLIIFLKENRSFLYFFPYFL